jgi:[histone H3]-lysine36 N-trimethyltransferase
MRTHIYQLFPHIKYVMDKFRNKLPKEDLKKFAKEIGKKLVASDFKHNRVEDPTQITTKQEKKVKKYVKDFFDKAVAKKAAHDKMKADKKHDGAAKVNGIKETSNDIPSGEAETEVDNAVKVDELDDMELSDDGEDLGHTVPSVPVTPSLETPSDEGLKRKRDDLSDSFDSMPSATSVKRIKEEDMEGQPSPPPPPPPPPAEDMIMQMDEDAELAAQEEALMRENEEALMRENEEAMHDAELQKKEAKLPLPLHASIDNVSASVNGFKSSEHGEDKDFTMKEVNGNAMLKLEAAARDSKDGARDLSDVEGNRDNKITQHERKEVLSH